MGFILGFSLDKRLKSSMLTLKLCMSGGGGRGGLKGHVKMFFFKKLFVYVILSFNVLYYVWNW